MKLRNSILAVSMTLMAMVFSCNAHAQNYVVDTKWNPVFPPTGATWVASGYNVYRSDSPGGYQMGQHISPTVTTTAWTDTSVQNGKTYYYNVTTFCATCTAGKQESLFGPEFKVTVPSPVSDVGPPTNPGGFNAAAVPSH